jgi:hypothetical protein
MSQASGDGAAVTRHGSAQLRAGLMGVVIVSAILSVFVGSLWLDIVASSALALFLLLAWRQFSVGTWVPLILSIGAMAIALWQSVPGDVLISAMERMIFLASLIAVLNTLRSAALLAPEVARAGAFLTSQPASRRYVSLSLGGHLFGVLINFGGLALLLDLAKRSMDSAASQALPEEIREVKLRRMSLATMRGFGLISLWSPLGFATNAVLITLPGLVYTDFAPIGFAMSFVFIGVGWLFDRVEGRRYRAMALPRPAPPQGAWLGAVTLVLHVLIVGGSVFLVHGLTRLTFQEALILVVPSYAVLWSAVSGFRRGAGAAGGVREAFADYRARLPWMGAEVGVFASAGFLPVTLLALVPVEAVQGHVAALGLGAVPLAVGIAVGILAFAMLGINPIVSTSVLGSVAFQLEVPGLTPQVIALAAMGGWTSVIGLSPFITTIILASSILKRSVWRVGPGWNGPYCLSVLAIWLTFLVMLMWTGRV